MKWDETDNYWARLAAMRPLPPMTDPPPRRDPGMEPLDGGMVLFFVLVAMTLPVAVWMLWQTLNMLATR